MSTASRPVAPAHVQLSSKSEERRVIFASSLGTVFEWYDFYLYATLAPFFAALVLPQGQRDRGAAVGVRHLCRGLSGAAVRRAGVRAHRRPGRPQIHVPGHDRHHGLLDVRGRLAADLCSDRLAGADPAGLVAAAAGPGARRRVRRRRDLRGGARAAEPARLRHELDPDDGDAGLLPGADRHRRLPLHRRHGRQATSPTGVGGFRSWCRWSC